MAAEGFEKEFQCRLELLEKAFNSGEVNKVTSLLKEKVGNHQGKTMKEGFESLSLMDLILHYIKHDIVFLEKILNNAQISLNNPTIAESITNHLLMNNEKREEIIKLLGKLKITVPQSINSQSPDEIHPVMVVSDIEFSLFSFLASFNKDQERENNKKDRPSLFDLIKWLTSSKDKNKALDELAKIDENAEMAVRIDDNGKENIVLRQGVVNELFVNDELPALISPKVKLSEVADNVKEKLDEFEKKFHLKNENIAEIRPHFTDPKKTIEVTVGDRRAEQASDLIAKNGERGVEVLKALGIDKTQSLFAELKSIALNAKLEGSQKEEGADFILPKLKAVDRNEDRNKNLTDGEKLTKEEKLRKSAEAAEKRAEERKKAESKNFDDHHWQDKISHERDHKNHSEQLEK